MQEKNKVSHIIGDNLAKAIEKFVDESSKCDTPTIYIGDRDYKDNDKNIVSLFNEFEKLDIDFDYYVFFAYREGMTPLSLVKQKGIQSIGDIFNLLNHCITPMIHDDWVFNPVIGKNGKYMTCKIEHINDIEINQLN